MTQRLASSFLADRGSRLAGVGVTNRLVPRSASAFPTAPVPQEPDRAEPAAPSSTSLGGAAFSHFTECAGAKVVSAGAATSNAILLPDHMMVLVRAIAAYERCSNERAVGLALAEYVRMIGAGPLARAVADLDDEFADVPAFERQASNRFRGGP